MLKDDYTVKVYKKDARKKTGERLVSDVDYMDKTIQEMEAIASQLVGDRIVVDTKYEMVRNAMSGTMVKQAKGTPRCCDVSSELYWTM